MPLKAFSDVVLSKMIEENLIELGKYFGSAMKSEFCENSSLSWFLTGIPLSFYNAVISTNLEEKEADRKIDMLLNYYQMHHVPVMWWIGPSTRPKNLGAHLQKHGFVHSADLSGMAADLEEIANKEIGNEKILIRRVDNVKYLKYWMYVFQKGFRIPDEIANSIFEFEREIGFSSDLPWQRYVGFVGKEPACTSGLFLGKEAAGIYNVSTLPSFRNRGFGSAITIKTSQAAYSFGYRIGVLQSSNVGRELYQRIGFQPYCMMSQYVWLRKEIEKRSYTAKNTLNSRG